MDDIFFDTYLTEFQEVFPNKPVQSIVGWLAHTILDLSAMQEDIANHEGVILDFSDARQAVRHIKIQLGEIQDALFLVQDKFGNNPRMVNQFIFGPVDPQREIDV